MRKVLARFVRQSPAMVVAMIALFVALSGTAVATTSALITGKQIKNNSITGADIKNKSIAVGDLATRARGARGVRGLRGLVGPPGAAGAAGAAGAKGDKGDIGPSSARTAYRDGAVTVTGSFGADTYTTVATMSNVEAGSYAIFGKSFLDVTPIIDASGYANCRLVAGGDSDTSSVNMGGQAQQVSRATVGMQVGHTFAAAGTIVLQCNKGGATVTANHTKITAIKVGSVVNEAVGG